MIARIWRTKVQSGAEADYERFAQEQSLPMFRAQAGCLGVLFLRSPEDRAVLSLWVDERAVAALSTSPTYQETAQRLTATGVLAGTPTVEVFQVDGGFLEGITGEDG
jgi:heme-degrading monooxygenase HmoA